MLFRLLAALRRIVRAIGSADEPDLCDRFRKVWKISNDDIRGIGA